MLSRAKLAQLGQLLAGRIPASPDWEKLMYLAGEELVVPQLFARLQGVMGQLPGEVVSYLAETQRRSLMRNEKLFATLGDALRALNGAGLEPVLLKGSALWATDEGPGDRLIRDLDLLVKPQEMERAVASLSAAGFGILQDDRAKAVHEVVVLGRATDPGSIDLHQHAPALHDRGEDDHYRHTRRIAAAGGVARVLTPEAQIFVMAIHDQVHDAQFWRGGYNLRHLLDIATLTQRGVDWNALMALCRTRTERIALGAQLHAARELAQAEIPAHVLTSWTKVHYWRQCAQFEWPALTLLLDAVRMARGGLEGREVRLASAWR